MSSSRSVAHELIVVVPAFAVLTVLMTWPLAWHLGTLGRTDNGDWQFSVWNIAWVARTLAVDPLHVFDANIFHPHRWTLAYSESNLGAGVLAIPVYWATGNAYAAHNFVFLLSFVLSATGMYCLARYLVGDARAAAVAAICFAFCPYVFGHTPHIQLMMTAGLPFSMLAFHAVADRPTPGRGAALGLAMAAQALFCGYYAVFIALMVGFAVLMVAALRRRWTDRSYWAAVAVAAGVAVGIAIPLLAPYLSLQRATGFARSLDAARQWSADWRAYFASSSPAHGVLKLIASSNEALFPGVVAGVAGVAGLAAAGIARDRLREAAFVYAGLAALAFWASFGPGGGLYSELYRALPVFSFLHAPSRFGIVVTFALCVLAAIAMSALFRASSRPTLVAVVLLAIAIAELRVPLAFRAVPALSEAYHVLADLPPGAVIEMPVYSRRFAFARTQYMLASTVHWKPLVNAYSDHIPQDFTDKAEALGGFPSRASFAILERDRVRYAVFHLDLFDPPAKSDVLSRLAEFDRYLVRRYSDDRIRLYEIVGFPR